MYTLKCIIALSCVAILARGAPRILGGHDAQSNKYPYIVSLRSSTPPHGHFCAGSIVSDRWILTAAMCVYKFDTTMYTISAGTYHLNETGTVYEPDLVVLHPDPIITGWGYAVALIRTRNSIIFDEFVKPAKLPQVNQTDYTGYSAMFAGWGRTNTTSLAPANKLQEFAYEPVDCRPWGWSPITVICTQVATGAGCTGDEGGPLVIEDIQVGVGASRLMCFPTRFPDVFTRVYYHMTWIDGILNSTFILPPSGNNVSQ